ncbi:hypothetical protein BD289DRAFT_444030 [Coniella lustricola]|uniref:Uncharacterized protein n=1 Tax=Coniella lustricola TaxID=2025994 RepID=A0A2T2ZWC6_9PEZI|nr:hypothetical protein BD289DRAFT_444030 [Coniella lustricola]
MPWPLSGLIGSRAAQCLIVSRLDGDAVCECSNMRYSSSIVPNPHQHLKNDKCTSPPESKGINTNKQTCFLSCFAERLCWCMNS